MPILITFLFVSHIFLAVLVRDIILLESLSHLLVVQNICKAFFVYVIIMENFYDKY
jgi:hypothetical protein